MDENLMRLLEEKKKKREEVALVTVLSSSGDGCNAGGRMALIDRDGRVIGGSLGGGSFEEKVAKEAKICIERGNSRKLLFDEEGSPTVFIKAICNYDRLIIVGSGELPLNLYRIARILDYSVTVVDNRSETLTAQRFPEAELCLGEIPDCLRSCEIDEDTSIVIATHHHQFDEVALKAVIFSPARYIGVLSNRHRALAYLDSLRALNVPDELLRRVYTPLGLDLGGRKTAEIALAAMAEIIAVKYGGSRDFCRNKHLLTLSKEA